MRWRPEPPKYPAEMPWWMWLLFPAWGPAIGLLLAIVGIKWGKRWLMGPSKQWRPWFAWYPVTVAEWPDEERAWLEWVERRAGHFLGDADYRPLPGLSSVGGGGE